MLDQNSAKLKALQLTLDKLDKTYGKGAVMKLGDEVIEEVERGKTQIIKSVIDEFFVVSNDKKDCVSKKVFCDMLQLDYNSKIDIRLLSTILKEYDVIYNRIKVIKGVTGVYFGIKLLE